MSRRLLVMLREDLDNLPGIPPRTTRPAVFRGILQVPGIESITDMEDISPLTYEEWMLPRDQSLVPVRKRAKRKVNDVNNAR